jgi:AcrR family transcriptional regulator
MFNTFVQTFNSCMDMETSSPRSRRSAVTVAGGAARPDRKAAILLAAEKLFAQSGYHAVTIRQIAVEADVPLALVGYYYGQKHELFEAIFAHWNATIEERLQALRDAESSHAGDARLQHIIEAFVAPVLRMRASSEGEYYALLVARELFYATEVTDRVLRAYFDPLATAFIDALQRSLPQASRSQIAWCYQFALGALMHHLSDVRVQRLSGDRNTPNDPAAKPLLVNFIVGGMRAALAPKTTKETTP